MELFYSLGLKTHIQFNVGNAPTNEKFTFLFKKVIDVPATHPVSMEDETK